MEWQIGKGSQQLAIAAARARGETGTKASGASRRERRKMRRRRGRAGGQVPVTVTGSASTGTVVATWSWPRRIGAVRPRRIWTRGGYLAQRGRHVVAIGSRGGQGGGPTGRLMLTATTTPVLSPNPRAAHTWRALVGQPLPSAANLLLPGAVPTTWALSLGLLTKNLGSVLICPTAVRWSPHAFQVTDMWGRPTHTPTRQ